MSLSIVSGNVSSGIANGPAEGLTLRQLVKAVVIYFRTNVAQEVIGELLFVDQSTISRVISDLGDVIAEVRRVRP